MTTLRLKPKRGEFIHTFGCGWSVRESLSGNAPYWSPVVNSTIGAPRVDIPHYLREDLRQIPAMDRISTIDIKGARKEKLHIDPNNTSSIQQWHLARIPYNAYDNHDHSLVPYFSNLQWLGRVQLSVFRGNYPPGQPHNYYRLTVHGKASRVSALANPCIALYKGH